MIKNLLSVFIIIFTCLNLKATMSYNQDAEANKFYIRWPEWMLNNFSELSIEDLKNKSANQISKEMVQRRSLELSKENSSGYDFMSNSTILLEFPSYLTKKIAQNGFLNQHQTSTGLGNANSEQSRDLLEQGLYKTRFPNLLNENPRLVEKINQIRPKSSFIQFNDVKNFLDAKKTRAYGDIMAVFVSNDIKERTVFTERDSLVLGHFMKEDIGSVQVTPLTVKGLDKPADINDSNYREALIGGEITMQQVDHFLIGCKEMRYREGVDDYFSEAYYNDINHKNDLVDALHFLLGDSYKVFECSINPESQSYEKGREITENNLFYADYLKFIENKVDNIIKPQIDKLRMEIIKNTKEKENAESLMGNSKIDEKERRYYENKIDSCGKKLIENMEKLNNLLAKLNREDLVNAL